MIQSVTMTFGIDAEIRDGLQRLCERAVHDDGRFWGGQHPPFRVYVNGNLVKRIVMADQVGGSVRQHVGLRGRPGHQTFSYRSIKGAVTLELVE